MKKPIVEMLQRTAEASAVRFHMPGHKGRLGFLPPEVLQYDITELSGTDNLYMPSGAILKSQEINAQALGARSCFFLVNGSSIGVEASLLSVASPGEKVIFARDFHLSAVSGIVLSGIKPVFVYPSSQNNYLPSVVTARDVKRVISENEDAKAVYLTYPNYYGLCPDLNEIVALAHSVGMYVVVDGAHAAAFAYSDMLPVHPGEAGADIWTMSLHKTLHAPNQCAVLCTGEQSDLPDGLVKRNINLLQTTSPSYLLLASMDHALAELRENGAKMVGDAVLLLEEFILRVGMLGGYKCITADIPRGTGAVDRDITKLVIDVTDRGMTGFMAEQKLCKRGIYIEGADHRNIILMCSYANNRRDFEQLLAALNEINGTNFNIANAVAGMQFNGNEQINYSMRNIMLHKTVALPFIKSVGRMAACTVGTYPPGVPYILPGQVINIEALEHLVILQNQGYALFGTDGYSLDVADI
jgi:arginine/lysine/ornithine decarboxylase